MNELIGLSSAVLTLIGLFLVTLTLVVIVNRLYNRIHEEVIAYIMIVTIAVILFTAGLHILLSFIVAVITSILYIEYILNRKEKK